MLFTPTRYCVTEIMQKLYYTDKSCSLISNILILLFSECYIQKINQSVYCPMERPKTAMHDRVVLLDSNQMK